MSSRFHRWTCLALLVAFTGGCATFNTQARDKLIAGDAAYRKGDYRNAEMQLNAVITQYPSATESAEAYYIRGLCHEHAYHHAAAESDFRRCLALSKRPDLTARAEASLGHLFYDSGNFPEAAQHYAVSLPGLGNDPGGADVYLRYGICLQRLTKWDDARQQFSMVMHRFAGSKAVEEARRRFAWSIKGFSIQCGVFQSTAPAGDLIRTLRTAKFDARRAMEPRSGKPMQIVYVGQYATFGQAQAALAAVRKIVPDAILAP